MWEWVSGGNGEVGSASSGSPILLLEGGLALFSHGDPTRLAVAYFAGVAKYEGLPMLRQFHDVEEIARRLRNLRNAVFFCRKKRLNRRHSGLSSEQMPGYLRVRLWSY